MQTELAILLLLVATALAFDFTNGFHDTANAMATAIVTGALRPRTAVALSGVLNFVGALISVEVALTVTNAVVNIQQPDGLPRPEFTGQAGGILLLFILLGALAGAILWNLVTWLFGLPSSSSHALLGGMMGGAVAAVGFSGVKWVGTSSTTLDGAVGKVILPAVFAPVVAAVVAWVATWGVRLATRNLPPRYAGPGFRWGQIGAASLMSLAHGTNDAQKTMGLVTLALIGTGHWRDTAAIPLWVKMAAAGSMALGTWIGGWRIIRVLGKGVVDINPAQGMSAQTASAATILVSSQLGFALSTTHVATGAVVGTGLGQVQDRRVRWRVFGRIAAGWLVTLPAAGLVAAVMVWLERAIGGLPGALTVVAILVVASAAMYRRSRRDHVGHHNVNDDWEPSARSGAGDPPAADSAATLSVSAGSASGGTR